MGAALTGGGAFTAREGAGTATCWRAVERSGGRLAAFVCGIGFALSTGGVTTGDGAGTGAGVTASTGAGVAGAGAGSAGAVAGGASVPGTPAATFFEGPNWMMATSTATTHSPPAATHRPRCDFAAYASGPGVIGGSGAGTGAALALGALTPTDAA